MLKKIRKPFKLLLFSIILLKIILFYKKEKKNEENENNLNFRIVNEKDKSIRRLNIVKINIKINYMNIYNENNKFKKEKTM